MANKFEKLIEYIINEDETKAKALFHQIVVEKSREIYEDLKSHELGAEELGNEIGSHSDVIDGDEYGMHEEEGDEFPGEDDGMGDDMDSGEDIDMDNMGEPEGEMGDLEAGGEEGLEDRVMDLEDALDELKAEFDELMADEEHEEDEFPGIHGDEEGDGEEEMPDELDGGDEEGDGEEEMPGELGGEEEPDGEEKKFGEASIYGESKKTTYRKSPADLMREYVEKVTAVKPTEGDYVGTGAESGGKPSVNTKSVNISGKNDMGGTTANIARGGNESAPDGTSPKKASNAYTKGESKLPGADNFANVPGADKKATTWSKKSATGSEGSPVGAKNTMGSNVNDKSIGQVTNGKPGFKG